MGRFGINCSRQLAIAGRLRSSAILRGYCRSLVAATFCGSGLISSLVTRQPGNEIFATTKLHYNLLKVTSAFASVSRVFSRRLSSSAYDTKTKRCSEFTSSQRFARLLWFQTLVSGNLRVLRYSRTVVVQGNIPHIKL